jgi:hypothetical protein
MAILLVKKLIKLGLVIKAIPGICKWAGKNEIYPRLSGMLQALEEDGVIKPLLLQEVIIILNLSHSE